jgi:YaiO family outer membrane protein
MMRLRRLARPALAALALACVAMSPADAQQIRQQGLGHAAVDVDSVLARATTLRRQNRRREAAKVVKQARAIAPNRADVRALDALLEQELHGGEALATVNEKSWRQRYPEQREGAGSLRQNTAIGPIVARASYVERGPLSDDRLEIEAYPAFPNGYLALGAGLATDATLYARTTASAEAYATLGGNVEGSAGYRRMNFSSGVDLVTGSLGTYLGNNFLSARVTNVLHDGGTSVLVLARRFLTDDGQYVGLRAATGSVPVELFTSTDFEVRFSQSVGAEGRFVVLRRLVLSAGGEVGREGLSGGGSSGYTAARIGLGVRY